MNWSTTTQPPGGTEFKVRTLQSGQVSARPTTISGIIHLLELAENIGHVKNHVDRIPFDRIFKFIMRKINVLNGLQFSFVTSFFDKIYSSQNYIKWYPINLIF